MALPDKKPYERLSDYLERALPGELEAGKSRGKATADIIFKFNEKPASELFAPSVIGFAGNGIASETFDSDYQAVLSYAISQGYILPSIQQQVYQNDLVEDMKAAGAWDGLEFFYVFASNGSDDFTFINWANPGTNQATVTFGPIRETNIGWGGDATGYINTYYNASTSYSGGADVSMGAWVPDATTALSKGTIMGCSPLGEAPLQIWIDRTFIGPDPYDNTFYAAYVSSSDNPNSGALQNSLINGLWVVENATGTNNVLKVNDTTLYTSSVGPTNLEYPNGDIWLLGRNVPNAPFPLAPADPSTFTLSMAFFGDRAVGQNIYTPFDDYLNKI